MSEKRPYMNPETGEVKMLTEEEAEALNKEEETKERASALKKEKKGGKLKWP